MRPGVVSSDITEITKKGKTYQHEPSELDSGHGFVRRIYDDDAGKCVASVAYNLHSSPIGYTSSRLQVHVFWHLFSGDLQPLTNEA